MNGEKKSLTECTNRDTSVISVIVNVVLISKTMYESKKYRSTRAVRRQAESQCPNYPDTRWRF